jgi:hypothetical protein
MTKLEELELFDYLARQHRFRDWLQTQLAADITVLSQALEVDQLRKAQGRVGLLNTMLTLLDKAPDAVKR